MIKNLSMKKDIMKIFLTWKRLRKLNQIILKSLTHIEKNFNQLTKIKKRKKKIKINKMGYHRKEVVNKVCKGESNRLFEFIVKMAKEN